MDRKIRVGAVSYLNTKPLIYGFEQGLMKEEVELVLDFPANIAAKLLNDEIDIGLVPVAMIPQLKEYYILSDYCISSDGPVASVCIFSEVPIEEITEVLLDYQSRTSVRLAKILMKEYWKREPIYIDTHKDFRNDIKGSTAGVIIGDRALAFRNKTAYIYDLGEAWQQLTGLPFVYAAWISNKKLDEQFILKFNSINRFGVAHIEDVIRETLYAEYSLDTYYYQNIEYNLNDVKLEGLSRYLHYLDKYSL